MVMVMKKLQCNGYGNDYFQKLLAPSLTQNKSKSDTCICVKYLLMAFVISL